MAEKGDDSFVKFPKAFAKEDHFDFSYSGLKTAVLTFKNKHDASYVQENMNNICASFRKAAIDILIEKGIRAARKYKAVSVAVAGGVAANKLLRRSLNKAADKNNLDYYEPEFQFCTDNAAMIARTGIEYLEKGTISDQSLNAFPSLSLVSLD
jgi:N6-L-threonylcarbamoyladenine synthase